MFMEQFTSSQVIERTGITPRQLQWWDERGVVVPARAGRRRVYSTDDLAEALGGLFLRLAVPGR